MLYLALGVTCYMASDVDSARESRNVSRGVLYIHRKRRCLPSEALRSDSGFVYPLEDIPFESRIVGICVAHGNIPAQSLF